jgi:hypothetical protein
LSRQQSFQTNHVQQECVCQIQRHEASAKHGRPTSYLPTPIGVKIVVHDASEQVYDPCLSDRVVPGGIENEWVQKAPLVPVAAKGRPIGLDEAIVLRRESGIALQSKS